MNEQEEKELKGEEYDASQIQILEGLEAVRKRPGMYIGTTSIRGLHHLIYEIVDNSVDEAHAGFCNQINVTLNTDNSCTVEDNGRGIPVGMHEKAGIPAVEVVFTILHAGGKFGGGGYKVSGGLHGVGASVVNALSDWLEVEICHEGKIYKQRYERGKVIYALKVVGECDKEKTGTRVTFHPDPEIFEETVFDFKVIADRMREMAFLTAGLKIVLTDLRDTGLNKKKTAEDEDGGEITETENEGVPEDTEDEENEGKEEKDNVEVFHYEGGIREFVSYLNQARQPLYEDVIYCSGERNGVIVEVALQHNDAYNESIYSFVNNINTPEGGMHLTGFRNALTRTVNKYARDHKILKENEPELQGEDIREGLAAIISVKISEPQFEGQTKQKLGNSEARTAVDAVMNEQLTYFLEQNPGVARIIADKSVNSQRAREAARKAREATRRKSPLETSTLPGKLVDCTEKDPKKCEIFIVEGDSALGPAKNCRDVKFQAVMPLRGKVLNVEKARLDKIYANKEIQGMITAFGTGIHDDFDISKLRYDKIIIMTDADVDGAHIATLMLTFIYRFMPQLIKEGHVYLAQPPLYYIRKNKALHYAYSEEERDRLLEKYGKDSDVQRFKGLGEMEDEELSETTMAPETRTLLRVSMDEDAKSELDLTFTTLMGDEVEPRRLFIERNAKYVKNLDV